MDSLILIAAAIPFVIFAVVFVLLYSVRFGLTETRLSVSIMGITIRSVRLSDITSVEHVERPGHGLPGILSRGETIIVRHGPEGAAFTVLTKQPEFFMEALRARVRDATGREL